MHSTIIITNFSGPNQKFIFQASIERKINQIIEVVSLAHDTGTHWLDGLLRQVRIFFLSTIN